MADHALGEEQIRRPARNAERAVWIGVLAVALAFGFASGIRLIDPFPATFALFDYSFGFAKRCLVGELLSWVWAPPYSLPALTAVFLLPLISCIALFLVHLFRSPESFDFKCLLGAIFFVSHGFVYFVSGIGFFDHLGFLVLALAMFLPGGWLGVVLRAVASVLAVLIHEAFFLLFFPLVVLDAYLRLRAAPLARTLVRLSPLLLAGGIATYLAGNVLVLPSDLRPDLERHLAEKADGFRANKTAVDTLFLDGADNVEFMSTLNARRDRQIRLLFGWLVTLPVVLVFLVLSTSVLAKADLSDSEKRALGAMTIAASLSPQVLHVLGLDVYRFDTVTILTACMAFLLLDRHVGPVPSWGRSFLRHPALVFGVVLLSAGTELIFVGGGMTRKIPFRDVLQPAATAPQPSPDAAGL